MSEAGDQTFFRYLESHRVRGFVRLMRHLPGDPRCAMCRAPYGGVGGRIMGRFGFAPSRKNPRLCSPCFEKAPMGGVEMEVGILFADVRGFTSLAERQSPDAVAALLNRFYATAVDVLCRHAIIDKLVGDQVMALYLPGVFPGQPAEHMVADARALLVASGYLEEQPWVRARRRARLRLRVRRQRRRGRCQGLHGDRRRGQHGRASPGCRGKRGDRHVQPCA